MKILAAFPWKLSWLIHISVHHSPLGQSNLITIQSPKRFGSSDPLAPVKLLLERSKTFSHVKFPTSWRMVPDKVLPFNRNLASWRKWLYLAELYASEIENCCRFSGFFLRHAYPLACYSNTWGGVNESLGKKQKFRGAMWWVIVGCWSWNKTVWQQ